MIENLAVSGYRLFRSLQTRLCPGINVLIGANGSGKSTFVELLRIIRSCCLGPIPHGIEGRPFVGTVFHPQANGIMALGITLSFAPGEGDLGRRRSFHYRMGVRGAAPPVISDEELVALPDGADPRSEAAKPLLRASGGRGHMLEGKSRDPWEIQPNEPMLSRATDPTLRQSSLVRNDILGWRFYTDLQVSGRAPLRQPQPLGSGTALSENGENLAPALLSLFTNLDYREERDQILSFMRPVMPALDTITPTVDTSGKYVVLQWREKDIDATLSSADVSDGDLRLLTLGAICCNPHPPSLICIDEPEIGLHPKVLAVVGGLLRRAAQRSQVIVLTHSPDLLYGMPIESIAVLRREEGEAKIVWAESNELLYELVSEEVAGEHQVDPERLRDAFISGELDVLG